jgi:hypothetical protein
MYGFYEYTDVFRDSDGHFDFYGDFDSDGDFDLYADGPPVPLWFRGEPVGDLERFCDHADGEDGVFGRGVEWDPVRGGGV